MHSTDFKYFIPLLVSLFGFTHSTEICDVGDKCYEIYGMHNETLEDRCEGVCEENCDNGCECDCDGATIYVSCVGDSWESCGGDISLLGLFLYALLLTAFLSFPIFFIHRAIVARKARADEEERTPFFKDATLYRAVSKPGGNGTFQTLPINTAADLAAFDAMRAPQDAVSSRPAFASTMPPMLLPPLETAESIVALLGGLGTKSGSWLGQLCDVHVPLVSKS
ncbi:hypothetical protein CYMTET_11136 [Cymbomonas tetramitiformis]|uniref:Uncharacterized protein n=1 Tax=Cymbomonas tetramitiformis TaxID=36881 RepID=A0AAE0GMR3_9CHLO|nr:hypothetical protein CYMTET_11136 [Cymbomonas tetramitiformis]